MKQASIDAYYRMLDGPKLGAQQQAIIAHLARHCHRDFTRAELAEAIKMRVSSVCGRVNELLAIQTIVEAPRRKCAITGSQAHPIQLAPMQGELLEKAA